MQRMLLYRRWLPRDLQFPEIAGDAEALQSFIESIRPYRWRMYLRDGFFYGCQLLLATFNIYALLVSKPKISTVEDVFFIALFGLIAIGWNLYEIGIYKQKRSPFSLLGALICFGFFQLLLLAFRVAT